MAYKRKNSPFYLDAATANWPAVVIAGRPNVGKSTFFNRLSGRQIALVDSMAGVTRDTKRVPARLGDTHFMLLDTAGVELGETGLAGRLNKVAEDAVKQSDLILFLLDGKDGVTPGDEALAQRLRGSGKPVIVVVNKLDVHIAERTLMEAYSLGFEHIVGVSAAHGRGLDDLEEVLRASLPSVPDAAEAAALLYAEALEGEEVDWETVLDGEDLEGSAVLDADIDEDTPEEDLPPPIEEDEEGKLPEVLSLAVVGQPNAGKSTLVNALLGEDRMLTGPEAGLTRESVGTLWDVDGQLIELVDTPGLRRKAKVSEKLEKMSVGTSLVAISDAQAVLLVIDATLPIEQQDMKLAAHAVSEGKPMVIILNKWDAVHQKDAVLDEVQHIFRTGFSQVKDVPIVPVSALKQKGLQEILPVVYHLVKLWRTRIGTGQLNRFLSGVLETNPPPIVSNRRIKIKYMTQVAACTPTFVLWCNMPHALPDSYKRFLVGGLRRMFGLQGIVIRMLTRGGSKNPYAPKPRS